MAIPPNYKWLGILAKYVMMNKKGDHIDWIISIGIFLVFLMTIFVILKPGIIPEYKNDLLFSIVEENLKNEGRDLITNDYLGIYWTLYKTPLFVNTEECVKIDFPFSGNEKFNKVYVKKPDTISPAGSVSGNLLRASESKKYDLLHSKESFSLVSTQPCTKPDGSDPDILDEGDYTYGTTESFNGISLTKINNLRSQGYTNLKTKWNYPAIKEFKINVGNTPTDVVGFSGDPPIDVPVYTKSWSDWVLYEDGSRMSKTVTIMVW